MGGVGRAQRYVPGKLDAARLDQLLRKRRSKRYLDAVRKLDAGGHIHNAQLVNEIIEAIRAEFPEIEPAGILLGIVSECYLGAPYEVHTLDLVGQIVTHYKAGETMPGALEKARGLARHGGYAFVEVYEGCMRAVSESGLVSVVPC